MSMEDFLNHVLRDMRESRRNDDDEPCACTQRTTESIGNDLLKCISAASCLSGHVDAADSLMKLTRLYAIDGDFREAIDSMAMRILHLFPNDRTKHSH